MKILVNTSSIGPPLTGIGRYTLNLIQELLKHPDVSEIVGLTPTGLISQSTLLRLTQQWDQHKAHSTQAARTRRSLRTRVAALPGARLLWRKLRHFQAWYSSDQLKGFVYWEPNYLLLPFDGPSVATIHDISHLRMPEHHPSARITEMNTHLPHTLARATRLIAVSAFTRNEIISCLKPTQPIDIVSPGVDRTFFDISAQDCLGVKGRHNLPPEFILSVATLEPRKNLVRLVEAFAALPESLRSRYPLVLAGSRGWHTHKIESLINPLLSSGQVHLLGYVDQADMPALYSSATLLAYVSLYEGFGMPIAEAMAAGTAVLTSATSAMPEVASGHATLVDPEDTHAIQQQLFHLLTHPDERNLQAQSARQHANTFDWAHSAQQLLHSLQAAQQEHNQ